VTRFSLLYTIDHDLGMPLTSDYEAVHENTFLWLYTVMFRAYGDQLKNLLTDDTNNVYTENQPANIEYASVALFDENDPEIPTREQIDQLVFDAFSGSNLDTYIEGVQNLPSANPFRYVYLSIICLMRKK
jgi:hypothetical protein